MAKDTKASADAPDNESDGIAAALDQNMMSVNEAAGGAKIRRTKKPAQAPTQEAASAANDGPLDAATELAELNRKIAVLKQSHAEHAGRLASMRTGLADHVRETERAIVEAHDHGRRLYQTRRTLEVRRDALAAKLAPKGKNKK